MFGMSLLIGVSSFAWDLWAMWLLALPPELETKGQPRGQNVIEPQ